MRTYAHAGAALDLEDDEPGIRCVAAPMRDASRAIVDAVGVSATTPYMPDERMRGQVPVVPSRCTEPPARSGHRWGTWRPDRRRTHTARRPVRVAARFSPAPTAPFQSRPDYTGQCRASDVPYQSGCIWRKATVARGVRIARTDDRRHPEGRTAAAGGPHRDDGNARAPEQHIITCAKYIVRCRNRNT
ncbi:IclR family transcriptional regulator C-terminal domain-containing protein [Nocardia sp. NPDC050193]